MELLELVGDEADLALEAINLVEISLKRNSSLRETFDNLDKAEKIRLIQGLCAILCIRSYSKFYSEDNPAGILMGSIRESVAWEADAGRDGVHGKYQALKALDASIKQGPELFHWQLELLEEDQIQSSLTLPNRAMEHVIRELVNWFRYYSWFGYGKTGPENCQEALAIVKDDIAYLLDNGNLRYRNQ